MRKIPQTVELTIERAGLFPSAQKFFDIRFYDASRDPEASSTEPISLGRSQSSR